MCEIEMMKLILFTDNLGSGGAQRQLVGLADLLQRDGFEVVVALYQDAPFYKEYLDKRNIRNVAFTN